MLSDVLAGKRAEVKVSEGAFWRTFGGDQSPDDLETALQLVYRLFTTSVTADAAKLATCIRCASLPLIGTRRNAPCVTTT